MNTYLCTTFLEFSDRCEGQILGIGTEEECRKLRDLVPAVIIKDGDTPESAHVIVAPLHTIAGAATGLFWRGPKN